MADWKKIIVSGSSPDLNNITGSTLKLTGILTSSIKTPLVINSSGEIFTGSAYVTDSGVTGNGLDNNIAIIGAGGTQIQTASNSQIINANGAGIHNTPLIQADAGIFDTLKLSSSIHPITKTVLTLSSSFSGSGAGATQSFAVVPSTNLDGLKIDVGVTMSQVPYSNFENFSLAINDEGEVVQISSSEGSGGTSGVSGLTTCSNGNINLSTQEGSSTTSYEFIATKGVIKTSSADQVFVLNSEFSPLTTGDPIEIRMVGFQGGNFVHEATVGNIVGPAGTGTDNNSIPLAYAQSSSMSFSPAWPHGQMQGDAAIYRRITNTSTGIVEICLDDNISLQSVTASNGILISGSDASLEITGSLNATGSVTLDGVLTFNGFQFDEVDVGIITGSNTFGSGSEPSDVTHTFTGSVLITGSNLTLVGGTITGDGSNINNINIANTNIATLVDGDGITDFTYNGQSGATVSIDLDGSTLTTSNAGIKVTDLGIDTGQLKDDSVTAAKLNDNIITGHTDLATDLEDTNEFLIASASVNRAVAISTVTTFVSKSFASDNLFGESAVTYDFDLTDGTNTATLKLDGSGAADDDTVTFAGTSNGIKVDATATGDAGTVTIGLQDSVTIKTGSISEDLSVGGDATITGQLTVNGGLNLGNTGDLVVDGNLTVNGTTTTLNTQDLHVEDRFILIGSGSDMVNNTDVGIIFDSGSVDGAGMALYYNNSKNRLTVGLGVNDANMGTSAAVGAGGGGQGTASGHLVTAEEVATVTSTDTPTFGAGEIRLDNAGNIWMYVCPPAQP